jgi:hypothetical protein
MSILFDSCAKITVFLSELFSTDFSQLFSSAWIILVVIDQTHQHQQPVYVRWPPIAVLHMYLS